MFSLLAFLGPLFLVDPTPVPNSLGLTYTDIVDNIGTMATNLGVWPFVIMGLILGGLGLAIRAARKAAK